MPPSRGPAILLSRAGPSPLSPLPLARPFVHPQARAYTLAHAPLAPNALCRAARRPPRLPRASAASLPLHFSQTRFQSQHATPASVDPQSPARPDAVNETFLDPNAPLSDALHHADDRHVGFLFENYGVDFGWGPSSMMKYLFEMVHSTGPDFWVSIIVTGVLLRLSLVPLNRLATIQSTKMRAMAPVVKPLQERSKAAAMRKDYAEMQKYRAEVRQVYKASGIKTYHMFFNFLQIPFGFGCWRTFSNMAALHIDGMSTGGALWFQNLTVADPYYILPLVVVGTQFLSVKTNMDTNPAQDPGQRQMQTIMMYGLPAIFLPFVLFQPAAIQLHFLTTASFAGLLNMAFRSNYIRGLLQMPSQVMPPPSVIDVKVTPRNPASSTSASATAATAADQKTSLRDWASSLAGKTKSRLNRAISESAGVDVSGSKRKRDAALRTAQKHEENRQRELKQERERYDSRRR